MIKSILILSAAAITLTACVTVQEAAPIEEVVVPPVPVRTCSFESELTKVVVPAEYREGFTINTVESEPEYITDPETGEVREVTTQGQGVKTPYKILVKEEEIFYVNGENREVTDICGDDTPANAIKVPEGVDDVVLVTPAG